MIPFSNMFPRKRAFLPVIHCINERQAQTAVNVALENGADGVMLINQGGMPSHEVATLALNLSNASVLFVGMNLLGREPDEVLTSMAGGRIQGLWADDAGVRVEHAPTLLSLGYFRAARARLLHPILYFGGVAFKYQDEVPLEQVGALAYAAALGGVDVVTTSGPATGAPPALEKIELMAAALCGHPLAIASGMTPDNVAPYLPHTQGFLVASGIQSRDGVFDPAKTRAMADAAHS